ncbi:hypothetical protein GJAV_G00110640 [Gymnothorax javanicus]|nr:hypothetical protein GJAV_G00110640 [Gymnothorax javanicus]
MMEEVSIAVAYDAHIMNQTAEEDLLASLVADSKLRAALPNQKPKEMKLKDLFHKESQQPQSVEKYKRDNELLQKASIRLEQENDILAHELVNSKVMLRKHLDEVEDRGDRLNRELLVARQQLLDLTDEIEVQEAEMTMVKELFRSQLNEAESRKEKSLAIMAEYKQVCSQLGSRLEIEEAQAKTDLDRLKTLVGECEHCRGVFDKVRQPSSPVETRCSLDPDLKASTMLIQQKDLENELAEVKMQLVEANCRIQELEHQTGGLKSGLTNRQNWFNKALTTLRIPHKHQ